MRTTIFGLMMATLFFAACNSGVKSTSTGTTDTSTMEMAKVEYTCSMHPEVISDKPGKCPKCGMTLIEKKAEDHSGHQH